MNDGFRGFSNWVDRTMTPAIKTIVAANTVIFVAVFFLDPGGTGLFVDMCRNLGEIPAYPLQIWRYLTYAFMHADLFHILFNMFALVMFGRHLEDRWGSRYFWFFYLGTAVGAAVFHMLFTQVGLALGMVNAWSAGIPVIGASGAIYAVMLAFAGYYPNAPVQMLFLPITFKMKQLLLVMVFIGVVSQVGGRFQGDNVSHLTHLSGLAFGYILMAVRHRSWNFNHWQWR